jgi:quercetin dioxygenase-like cupin family protein
MQPAAAPIIRRAGDGERLWFAGGGALTIKAGSAETNGTFFLFEDHMPRGKVTPLHFHPESEETLIVLSGEILVYHEGAEQLVGPAGVVVVPRGVPHAFTVTSEHAHIFALLTPGDGEAFFRTACEPLTGNADRPPDWERLRAAAERHPEAIQIIGPPPFAPAR